MHTIAYKRYLWDRLQANTNVDRTHATWDKRLQANTNVDRTQLGTIMLACEVSKCIVAMLCCPEYHQKSVPKKNHSHFFIIDSLGFCEYF